MKKRSSQTPNTNMPQILAEQFHENYVRYLRRMTDSTSHSTKGLIPFFLQGCRRILDVGCGSGALLGSLVSQTDAELWGIDINQLAISHCKEQYPDGRINFLCCSLEEIAEKTANREIEPFDCIIFSSVLHEFSSYDEKHRFSRIPIINALKTTGWVLAENGLLIIRDGVKGKRRTVRFRFRDEADLSWLDRFLEEYHAGPRYAYQIEDGQIVIDWAIAKEFFFTFTWGENSWHREVKEQFGILTSDQWIRILEQGGFCVSSCMQSAEEYPKFLGKKIIINPDLERAMKDMTILLVARKMDQREIMDQG